MKYLFQGTIDFKKYLILYVFLTILGSGSFALTASLFGVFSAHVILFGPFILLAIPGGVGLPVYIIFSIIHLSLVKLFFYAKTFTNTAFRKVARTLLFVTILIFWFVAVFAIFSSLMA